MLGHGGTGGEKASRRVLRFGDFRVDADSGELFRGTEPVPLQEVPTALLLAFLARPGELVSRDELQDLVWGDRFVEADSNLNTAIAKLRRTLGDAPQNPTYIGTVPRRGYRWLAPVTSEEDSRFAGGAPRAVPAPATGRARRRIPGGLVATVAVLAAVLVAAVAFQREALRDRPLRRTAIAVLPLAGDGHGPLRRALREDLATELARRFPAEVGVIATTSVDRAVGSLDGETPGELGERLGSPLLLEGSVEAGEALLTIRLRLVTAADGGHLWATEIAVPRERRGEVAPRVTGEIARTLGLTLEPRPAASPPALADSSWEDYLDARWALEQGEAQRASDGFAAVLAREPGLAGAWIGWSRAAWQLPLPPRQRAARVRVGAERALALDPSSAEAHHELARRALYFDLDWQGAAEHYRRAVELSPNLAVLHHSMAALWSSAGQHERALGAIRRAEDLDPLSVVLQADGCWYLYTARRWDDAVARCRRALRLDPDHRGANHYLLATLVGLGRWHEAAEAARRVARIESLPDELRARLRGLDGREAVAALRQAQLAAALAADAGREGGPDRRGLAYLRTGDLDAAERELVRAYDEREGWLPAFLAVYPELDPLRDRPALATRIRELRAAQRALES